MIDPARLRRPAQDCETALQALWERSAHGTHLGDLRAAFDLGRRLVEKEATVLSMLQVLTHAYAMRLMEDDEDPNQDQTYQKAVAVIAAAGD